MVRILQELKDEGDRTGLHGDLVRPKVLLREFLQRTGGSYELCFDI